MAFDVVKWMTDHGCPAYQAQIAERRSQIDEIEAEIAAAGGVNMGWGDAGAQVDRLKGEIAEIEQAARDRYDDWATD